ncbi:uncharacterized protein her [Drosophila bipectinata]|uniref:uncharacterized protein her n=1 Tax=Drosophila bipectinata TaxID=42026 RepID=UPI001C89A72A|nr:uncharacterized protein LOC108130898 [Drosophila bipectinata]
MLGENLETGKTDTTKTQELRCNIPRCPYRTNRAYNLWRHEERHTLPLETKLLSCPFCIYSTDKVSNLKRHIGIRHPSTMDDPDDPESGKMIQTIPVERSTKVHCLVIGCKYETNRPYDMKRHMMVHNNREKSHRDYKCSLCMYSSDRKANLKRHHELRHSGIEDAIKTADELEYEERLLEEQAQEQLDQVAAPAKSMKHLFSSFEDDIQDNSSAVQEEELKADYIYGENAPLITISTGKSEILQGRRIEKQVIAVNVNGELRWFQSIDPPPGASNKLQLAMQEEQEQLDDELALSLAEEDQKSMMELLPEDEPIKEEPKAVVWSWSTPNGIHHFSTVDLETPTTEIQKIDDLEEVLLDSKVTPSDFPAWWDDGQYTKMQKNQTFRDLRTKPSQASVQRILRIIYDIYYKPFKEKRKRSEVFQIKDSWLCATRMSRMQIIKDMYSKQGT